MGILQRLFGSKDTAGPEDSTARQNRLNKQVAAMTESAMIVELRVMCRRFAANEDGQELVEKAKAIGEELNRRGGIQAMRATHSALGPIPGARTLDMVWNGIGGWMG